jgi:hypothetical protein
VRTEGGVGEEGGEERRVAVEGAGEGRAERVGWVGVWHRGVDDEVGGGDDEIVEVDQRSGA